MAFTPETKNPGDLVKSKDWNEAMLAIAALFAKLDAAAGHQHTGTLEDAPPLSQNGIADNAIVTSKLTDGAITPEKLQDNAVGVAKLQDGAVSNSKLQDGSVTLNKLAAGVIPGNIGIAITNALGNGSSIPIPSGFVKAECVFFAYVKAVLAADAIPYNCLVNDGVVRIVREAVANPGTPVTSNIFVTGVALAKRGGW